MKISFGVTSRLTNFMALVITQGCINCDACVKECPNEAISKGSAKLALLQGCFTREAKQVLHSSFI